MKTGTASEARNSDLAFDGVPKKNALRADAKAEIVLAFRSFLNTAGTTLKSLAAFVGLYGQSNSPIQVSAEGRELFPSITIPTLQRDWRRFQCGGVPALLPNYGNRRDKSIIESNPKLRGFILANIENNPQVRAPWLLEAIKVRLPSERCPKLSALKEFLARWKLRNRALFERIADPDGWRHRHMSAIGRMDAEVVRCNAVWEVDGSPADAFTLTEVNTLDGRQALLVLIDVHSRKMVALLWPTESSNGIAQLLRKAILMLGVPEAIRSDRGAGFISEQTQRNLIRVGTAHIICLAHRPDRKPFIERGIGTIVGFLENVPGFVGHNIVQASKIRSRHAFAERRGERRNLRRLYRVELTTAELQDLLDKWLASVYGERKRRELLGRSPNQVFAEADARGEIRRVADERVLDLLFAEGGLATVGPKGLRVRGSHFWSDELTGLSGQRIEYRHTRDAGKIAVYSADDAPKFICIAIDPDAAGLDRQVLAIAARQKQAAEISQKKQELRALKRQHKPERLYREIIDSAVARSAAALSPDVNIIALPYRGGGTSAAQEALAALGESSITGNRITKRDERKAEKLRAAADADDANWQRYQDLKRMAPESLSAADLQFFKLYAISAACKVRERLAGLAA